MNLNLEGQLKQFKEQGDSFFKTTFPSCPFCEINLNIITEDIKTITSSVYGCNCGAKYYITFDVFEDDYINVVHEMERVKKEDIVFRTIHNYIYETKMVDLRLDPQFDMFHTDIKDEFSLAHIICYKINKTVGRSRTYDLDKAADSKTRQKAYRQKQKQFEKIAKYFIGIKEDLPRDIQDNLNELLSD